MAIVNLYDKYNSYTIKITTEKNNKIAQINDKLFSYSIFKKTNKEIFLKTDKQIYKAKIIKQTSTKIEIFILNLNKNFTFFLKNKAKIDQRVKTNDEDLFIEDLKSPLSGRIIDIKVKADDFVKKNQTILIIESMKMENEIKALHDCFIKSILISSLNLVKTNQILMTFSKKGEFCGTIKNQNKQKEV